MRVIHDRCRAVFQRRKVSAEVRRRAGDLASGGGYVLASVHNIQAEVPPENVVAMWEAPDTLAGLGREESSGDV